MAPWPDNPPPGPFRPGFWRSPLRGPWLTAVIGSVLLVLVTIVAVTGFLSHAAYAPDLGRNAIVPAEDDVGFLNFDWPTSPSWLYALTQGLHVTVGFVAVPVLLAKLWSVIPRLFVWPPFSSPAQAVERAAIAVLVGSALFEFATGIVNAQVFYPFGFNFLQAHYFGGLVFVGSVVVHVTVKVPAMRRAFRERGVLRPLRDDLAHTRPEPHDPHGGLVAEQPAAPTLSRRGLLGFVAAGGGLVFAMLGGQAIGGPLRNAALLAPRRGSFPVNKTARQAAVTPAMTGPAWRLELVAGERTTRLSREELLALPQRTASLPIACVEGWSTTQRWTGVPLAELARMAGAAPGALCRVESLQPRGVLREATLSEDQAAHPDALLALRVAGEDLSLDHGYPARVIVPAIPGVHNTKWVARMTFA